MTQTHELQPSKVHKGVGLPRLDTGLIDSAGSPIFVGDVVKCENTMGQDFHGDWTLWEVGLRGLTPCLFYLRSETGQKMPPGYTASILATEYDPKRFLFSTDLDCRPQRDITVVDDSGPLDASPHSDLTDRDFPQRREGGAQ